MNHQPLFSVIVALHNSAGFARRMLDSIREQTFTDYELILICDRCTDNTEEVAREYSETVLVTDYGKPGPARNAGLDIARGEWILFADDDDWWLHSYAFELLADALKDSKSDVMNYAFIWKRGDRNVLTPGYRPDMDYNMWVAPWTKAWRRLFIGDHRFPVDWNHSDDLGFAQEMFPLVKQATFFGQALYYYNYMHKGSVQWKLDQNILDRDDMRG